MDILSLRTILLSFFIVTGGFKTFAQEYIETENIADANGAVEISSEGKYKIQMTGNYGKHKDYYFFKEISDVYEKNSVFLKYTAEDEGNLTLHLDMENGSFQTFVFKGSVEAIEEEMKTGAASLIFQDRNFVTSLHTDDKKINSISLKEGESIIISVNTLKRSRQILNLHLDFEFSDKNKEFSSKTKTVDMRKPEDRNYMSIRVRDLETKDPISAGVSISDRKKSLLFNGSDIYIGNDFTSKISLKCDAPNYFFQDTLISSIPNENQEITIYLRSVSIGKVLKIDKIEFMKGTANLIPGKEAILNRVKDFLVLNSDIRIEIQGHVNNEGKENWRTKNLSKRRAATIKKYFIDSGIDRKRLEHKGFGSDHPIYESPKNEYEQQANRRVEIKIIQ